VSGALEISAAPESIWLPSGWVYDDVLERLAAAVPDEAELFELAKADGGFAYADLREFPAERFAPLAAAARSTVREVLEAGPEAGDDARSFAQLVFGLSLLAGMLSADPRAGLAAPAAGRLVLSPTATWSAPGPAYELVREHLAGAAWSASGLLALRLLREDPDIGFLDAEAFGDLLFAVDWMNERYAPQRNLVAAADAYFTEVAPHIQALFELVRADPRTPAGWPP
jgi:hypothetical protein